MRIGIDIESGERSYKELIKGALRASELLPDLSIFIIGDTNKVRKEFPSIDSKSNTFLVNAKKIITMNESPASAVKRKKDATVMVGAKMLKNDTIDVFFSPGNTGATVAASVLTLGKTTGIKKPALAGFFPRMVSGETLLIDIGAISDCTEENLFHNALLGGFFYKTIYPASRPKIGLLNMGTEQGKGRHYHKKTFNYLKNLDNFVGNVESYNILDGSVDVVVCDGFTGNSILKTAEAMKELFIVKLREHFEGVSSKITGRIFKHLSHNYSFSDDHLSAISNSLLPQYYGSAVLLGVNGIVLIGHGMCGEDELVNSIILARRLYDERYLPGLRDLNDLKRLFIHHS